MNKTLKFIRVEDKSVFSRKIIQQIITRGKKNKCKCYTSLKLKLSPISVMNTIEVWVQDGELIVMEVEPEKQIK